MADQESFSLGEGGRETMKHLLRATVHGFVEADARPDECEVINDLESYISELPSLYRGGFIWLLRALELAPLIMGYRKQYSNLALEDQVEVLERFEASTNFVERSMSLSLKSLAIVIYFDRPEVQKALGYDHSCLLPGGVKP